LLKDTNARRAWKQTYKCTGIKHCQYYHPDILKAQLEYQRVDAEHIPNLRRAQIEKSLNLSTADKMKIRTQTWFSAIQWRVTNERVTCDCFFMDKNLRLEERCLGINKVCTKLLSASI
jgi:hypothetical protein